MRKYTLFVLLIILLIPFKVRADSKTPVQVSLGNPIVLLGPIFWIITPKLMSWGWEHPLQAFPKDWDVEGVRLSVLHSVNQDVSGLDVGFAPITMGNGTGVSISWFNAVQGTMKGVQIDAASAARNMRGLQLNVMFGSSNDFVGLQVAGLANINQNMKGVQLGFVNAVEGDKMTGLQIGLFGNRNSSDETRGMQFGLVNYAKAKIVNWNSTTEAMHGVQFGLINYTKSMKGVQIGLINVIEKGPLCFCPIINADF